MRTYLFYALILIFSSELYFGQVVIGSTNISAGAILKLDTNSKALRIPRLSVTNRTSTTTPIPSPALGVMIYNTNMDITNDITPSITYWASDNRYHSQTTPTATENIISSAQIPLLIFTAAIGQKPYTALGSSAGGSYTTVALTSSEILVDKYFGWNSGTNQYKVPSTGTYVVEFISEMSNSTNTGGTSVNRLLKNGTSIIAIAGRFVINRMYTTLISTQNFTANDLITFQYIFTANSYRIESGTINIYKY
ncbi:hypothetical protein M2347_000347 [Chryseobacterium sp. H1D6B]|uniref:hypothetical protein n=1 Tax=Chryseobacterium sp. H1D6B TaxID=2940588 RepID=UPI0015CC1F14|nr:hypothetical protein [Chryseobacterium sp. H1D6B]MDH6250620.1 hypothetical protein [Chryseobacterium sp. H1D6B]